MQYYKGNPVISDEMLQVHLLKYWTILAYFYSSISISSSPTLYIY